MWTTTRNSCLRDQNRLSPSSLGSRSSRTFELDVRVPRGNAMNLDRHYYVHSERHCSCGAWTLRHLHSIASTRAAFSLPGGSRGRQENLLHFCTVISCSKGPAARNAPDSCAGRQKWWRPVTWAHLAKPLGAQEARYEKLPNSRPSTYQFGNLDIAPPHFAWYLPVSGFCDKFWVELPQ